MGVFTSYRCVICLLLWWNVLASRSFVYGADSGENTQSVFQGYNYFLPLSLSASFPEQLELSDYCLELLRIFGQRYAGFALCLVSNSLPARVCQNCHTEYSSFHEIYTNISNNQAGNGSCQDVLMLSNRLMLVYHFYTSLQDIWDSADCVKCLTPDQKGLSNTTLDFMEKLNQSLSCFEKLQQKNQSELCKECRTPYKKVNELYNNMFKTKALCVDIEDSMNVTRRLWSKKFNCSVTRQETVTIIAVSCFMLFLPLIFYLSNFLHSEQKKRKLIEPKRARSHQSLMNIQDKFS